MQEQPSDNHLIGPNNETLGSLATHANVTSPSPDQTSEGFLSPPTNQDDLLTGSRPMENIATQDDDNSSDADRVNHRLNLKETIKDVGHSVKRKIYLHNRHQKDLSKQFSAGSVAKHAGKEKSARAQGGRPNTDVEAQSTHQPGPTFLQNLWIMTSTFPYWNMAFWSGWSYSFGSALFVVDGCWSWLPLGWPDTEFKGEAKYGVPLCFFFGAILYQIGAVMAYLEAVNDGSFAGAAMKRLVDGDQNIERELLDAKLHTFFGHIVPHHHADDHDDDSDDINRSRFENSTDQSNPQWPPLTDKTSKGSHEAKFDAALDLTTSRRGGVDAGQQVRTGTVNEYLTWRWWPTWRALWHYHLFEMGYIACTIQLLGVTLYGVTSIVIMPGILDSLAWWQELAAYWIPQVVSSCCFLTAGFMFTIMAQDKWYKPKFNTVSWWIGMWAVVGSVGFLLCSVFGLYSNDHTWAEYQSSLSSTWGSFFYMISGLFQWYEAINVNVGPVLAFPNNRTPVLLRPQRQTKPRNDNDGVQHS